MRLFWKCVRVGVSRLSSPSFLVLVLLLLLFFPYCFWFGGQDPAVELVLSVEEWEF